MRQFLLALPTLVMSLPLLAVLIAASYRARQEPVAPAAPTVVLTEEEGALPDNATMERLAKDDPCKFLENCLRRYQRDVRGYTCNLQKQEFLGGRLQPVEVTACWFREQPFSILMRWLEGARKAESVLYVEGQNEGKLLARPYGSLARRFAGDVVARDVDSEDARASGRFTLNQFGLQKSSERAFAAWKAAKEAGTLHVEYLGIQTIKELNGRSCFVLRRTSDQPEGDGYTEVTGMFDTENWMQIGAIAKKPDGSLMGEYYFRDVKVNPEFKPEQFTKAALAPTN